MGEHVDRRRVRSIAKLLDTPRRIKGGIENLPHAKFRKFHAILQGEHNLSAFAFVDLHADKHLEKAVPRAHGVVLNNPVSRKRLNVIDSRRKRINLCAKPVAFRL